MRGRHRSWDTSPSLPGPTASFATEGPCSRQSLEPLAPAFSLLPILFSGLWPIHMVVPNLNVICTAVHSVAYNLPEGRFSI